MTDQQRYRLLEDIVSHCKKDYVYARRNDKVTIITEDENDPVPAVENEKGERFVVRREKLKLIS